MSYLLTGASGFIGGNLIKALNHNDHICFVFEEDGLGMSDWKLRLEDYVRHIDAIFHVGAVSSTDASNITKTMYLNYEFSKILFDIASKYNKKVIYSSSFAVYGNGNNIPLNLYAWTKKCAEDYGLAKVQKFISLRYTNVYGGGEEHKGKMASVAYQAFLHKKNHPYLLFGLLPRNPQRDFVYIKDVISANIHAATYEIASGIYDVGCGEANTFEKCLELLNIEYFYKNFEAIPEWYQFYTCADKNKFLPGWTPKYNLEKGLKEYKAYLEEKP